MTTEELWLIIIALALYAVLASYAIHCQHLQIEAKDKTIKAMKGTIEKMGK